MIRVESAIEFCPLPMAVVEGATHAVRYVNQAFCDLVEMAREELVGKALPQGGREEVSVLLERVLNTRVGECLASEDHASPASQPVYWSYAMWPVFQRAGNGAEIVIQITDTTQAAHFRREIVALNEQLVLSGVRLHELMEEAAALNVRLRDLATTDGLTGLKNYRAFHERLGEEVERALRYAAPLSVLILDVDEFKAYNDAYGHPTGDRALRQIAELLRTRARASDLVARYGGEEFAVILPEADSHAAARVAERFRAAIEAADWPARPLTVSVGVATLSAVGMSAFEPTTLIVQADEALYRSKAGGRNRVTHSQEIRETLL